MKSTHPFLTFFTSMLVFAALIAGCSMENDAPANTDESSEAANIELALSSMAVYNDSCVNDKAHRPHRLAHHDSLFHCADSLYYFHHSKYYHGDTAQHSMMGGHHSTTQHHRHDSIYSDHRHRIH